MTYLKAFFKWLLATFRWQQPLTQRINCQPRRKRFIKKKEITIKRYSPLYPDIRKTATYTVAPATIKTESIPPVETYWDSSARVVLMAKLTNAFFGDSRRLNHAIHKMRVKHPCLNELEILGKMEDEYLIKRG